VNPINALRTALIDSKTWAAPPARAALGEPATGSADGDDSRRKAGQQRAVRLRVLAGSLLGVTLLFVAQRLLPHGGAPFALPTGWTAWLAAVCGIVGIWLVPGVWLSAVMLRTGTGPVAWPATRIGVLLAWYAVVGIVVHYSGEGARPTAWNIIGVTTAATTAACIGVALGLLPRPVGGRRRIIVSGLVGGVTAQLVILLAMHYWTYQVNYEHIRRLDGLLVLACAVLAALGAVQPALPNYDTGRIRLALVAVAALTATAAVTVMAAVAWPTTQHLSSDVAAEQVTAPPGADLAVALAGIGPQGSSMLRHASFVAADNLGRPVSARFRVTNAGTVGDRATLLVSLNPRARSALCAPTGRPGPALPVKVTVRDRSSGVHTQALLPPRWCAG
jgi:hypothetical protein